MESGATFSLRKVRPTLQPADQGLEVTRTTRHAKTYSLQPEHVGFPRGVIKNESSGVRWLANCLV